jgi:hypothetical protein
MNRGAQCQQLFRRLDGKVEVPGNILFNGSIETATEVYRTKRGGKNYVS